MSWWKLKIHHPERSFFPSYEAMTITNHDGFIFLYILACSFLTSIKGILNRAQIPSLKHSLDTNKVQGTRSQVLSWGLFPVGHPWCGGLLPGLCPRGAHLAWPGVRCGPGSRLSFLTETPKWACFPRPGRQTSVPLTLTLTDWQRLPGPLGRERTLIAQCSSVSSSTGTRWLADIVRRQGTRQWAACAEDLFRHCPWSLPWCSFTKKQRRAKTHTEQKMCLDASGLMATLVKLSETVSQIDEMSWDYLTDRSYFRMVRSVCLIIRT